MSLRGYDSWKTQTPEEYYNTPEQDIVYRVTLFSPHTTKGEDMPNVWATEMAAHQAGQDWLTRMVAEDPESAWSAPGQDASGGTAGDYFYAVVDIDRNADCTCSYRRRDKYCPIHGIDPDQERDDDQRR